MSYAYLLAKACEEANFIAQELHGLSLKSDFRSKAAAACFAIAQQHHSSILILLSNKPALEATAMALLRPLLEATFRGLWISHCATDEQVNNFVSGDKRQLDMASVIQALGELFNKEMARKVLHTNAWPILSSYTHTYEYQIQRWISTNAIEPNYSFDEIIWLLERAAAAMRLAASGAKAMITTEG